MRILVFIITIFVTNCSTVRKIDTTNVIKNLKLSIEVKDDRIVLTFQNKSDEDIYVNNPCPANTYFHVLYNKARVERKILIKVDPRCAIKTHFIKANTIKEIIFENYSLSQLFILEEEEEYEIYCEYYVNQKKLNSNNAIQSETIKFKNEK